MANDITKWIDCDFRHAEDEEELYFALYRFQHSRTPDFYSVAEFLHGGVYEVESIVDLGFATIGSISTNDEADGYGISFQITTPWGDCRPIMNFLRAKFPCATFRCMKEIGDGKEEENEID
jgi:hypothetical protein